MFNTNEHSRATLPFFMAIALLPGAILLYQNCHLISRLSQISLRDALTHVALCYQWFQWGNAEICTFLVDCFKWRSYVDPASPLTYLRWGILLWVTYWCYVLNLRPLNRVLQLEDMGYVTEPHENKKKMAALVQQMRKVGDCPPVYPNGWFGLMESFSLKVRESKSVVCIGLTLAVFRDEKGRVHVLDAYCPHMGANLAVGGQVKGDRIECPFHGWQFRGEDGKCMEVPYMERNNTIPEAAKVKSYPVCEVNNWIHFWFDAEGRDPTWRIPEVEEITSGQWAFRGRSQHHVNSHIEEVPENGADVAHLKQVHGPTLFAGVDLRYIFNKWWSFQEHSWDAAWQPLEGEEAHIGELRLTHTYKVFGVGLHPIDFQVKARQIGPGLVYMHFSCAIGTGMYMQSLTPIGPLMQKMVHNVFMDWWVPGFIPKFLLYAEARQVERDLMIWNNKRYAGRPVFVKSKEDALVAKHRKWYKQFYSENSPRLTMKESDGMQW